MKKLINITGFTALGILSITGLHVSCKSEGSSEEPSLETVSTIHAVGYIEPKGELRRLAFEGQGIIAKLNYDVGDEVRKGELIARLNDRVERGNLAIAKAKLASANANREQTLAGAHPDSIRAARENHRLAKLEDAYRKREQTRRIKLKDKRSISDVEVEEAEHEAHTAAVRLLVAQAMLANLENQVRKEDRIALDASVAIAKAEVEAAEALVKNQHLFAPADGTISEVFLREGEAVSISFSEPALLFAPAGPSLVRAEVDENYVGMVKLGASAWIKTPNSKQKHRGEVIEIKPIMGRKSVFSRSATERMDLQVLEVRIKPEDPPDLPLGIEVDVEISAMK